MDDFQIIVNGILCASRQRWCKHCDFNCAKWIPYDKERTEAQITVIEEVIKRWREALKSKELEKGGIKNADKPAELPTKGD